MGCVSSHPASPNVDDAITLLHQLGDPVECTKWFDFNDADFAGPMELASVNDAAVKLVGPSVLLHTLLCYVVGATTGVLIHRTSLKVHAVVTHLDDRDMHRKWLPLHHLTPYIVDTVRIRLRLDDRLRQLLSMRARRRLTVAEDLITNRPVAPSMDVSPHLPTLTCTLEEAIQGRQTLVALALVRQMYINNQDAMQHIITVALNQYTSMPSTRLMWALMRTLYLTHRKCKQDVFDMVYELCTCTPVSPPVSPPAGDNLQSNVHKWDILQFRCAVYQRETTRALILLDKCMDSCGGVHASCDAVWCCLSPHLQPLAVEAMLKWNKHTSGVHTQSLLRFATAAACELHGCASPHTMHCIATIDVHLSASCQ